MNRRITFFFSLLMVLAGLGFSSSAKATDYGIYVGETMVTDKNAKDILGNGYFWYDNSKKYLYVKAGITYSNSGGLGSIISNRTVSGLTVCFEGAATLTARNFVIGSQNNDMTVIFTVGKTVKMTSTGGYPISAYNCNLELTTAGGRAYVTAEGKDGWAPVHGSSGATLALTGNLDLTVNANSTGAIGGFDNVTLSKTSIALPSGATYDTSGKKLVDAFGDNVTNQTVRVVPESQLTKYALYVGGVQVNNFNAGNIRAKTISGQASYNSSKNTLTLASGTTIDMRNVSQASSHNCIDGRIADLNVESGSYVTLYGHSNYSAVYLNQNATVTTSSTSTVDAISLTIENASSQAGLTMRGGHKLTIMNAKIKTGKIAGYNGETGNTLRFQGAYTLVRTDDISNFQSVTFDGGNDLQIATPLGSYYNSSKGYVVNGNGDRVTKNILVAKTEEYPILWGENYVNNWAAADILGDGSKAARYVKSSDTKGTLYLKNVTFESQGALGSTISNRGITDFTIVAEGTNNITSRLSTIGTYFSGGDAHTLTIKGGGTLNLKATEGSCLSFGKNSTVTIDNVKINAESKSTCISGNDNCKVTLKSVVADIYSSNSSPISKLTAVVLDNCGIIEPSGAYWQNGTLYVNNKAVPSGTHVKIGPVTEYDLTVAGVTVTSANAGDVLGDGTVVFNKSYNSLTLTNANIKATGKDYGIRAFASANPLKIFVEGNCKIQAPNTAILGDGQGVDIMGDGTLELISTSGHGIELDGAVGYIEGVSITAKGPKVTINAKSYGIYGNKGTETFTISRSELTGISGKEAVYGLSKFTVIDNVITLPNGAYYDEGKKYLCDYKGNSVTGTTFAIEEVEQYPIEVAGIRLHSKNCYNVMGKDITGYVEYEPATHTLMLDNATIDTENWCISAWDKENTQLTIEVTGNCVMKNKKYATINASNTWSGKTTTIRGTGTLTITPDEGIAINGNGDLKFAGSVKVNANGIIHNFDDVLFDDGEGVIVPNSAFYDTANKVMPMTDGSPATTVQIGQVEYYGLWIGYTQVSSANKDGVTGKNISGTVIYNPATHTLTLNNAKISTPVSPISIEYKDWAHMKTATFDSDKLTIRLVGDNSYTMGDATFMNRDFAFKGPGTFKTSSFEFDGGNQLTVDDEATLECGYIYGTGKETVTVDFSTLKTTGAIENIGALQLFDTGFFSPDPAYFDTEKKMVVDGSGNKATGIHIGHGGTTPLKEYDVYVAGIRLNNKNHNGVTGTGITGDVTYDYNTHTLTLTDATIDGAIEDLDERGQAFNILVTGENTVKGIPSGKSDNVTISGSGTLSISETKYALTVSKNLTITNCTVNASLSNMSSGGILTIDGATISGNSIWGFDDVVLTGVNFLTPAGCHYDTADKKLKDQYDNNVWGFTIGFGTPLGYYEVYVADIQVTSENCGGVTGTGISGSVTYDYTTHTLTLDNATIDGSIANRDERGMAFSIVVKGKNSAQYIPFSTKESNVTICGDGELNLVGDESNAAVINVWGDLLIKDCTVTMATGISGNDMGTCTIDGATVSGKGMHVGIFYFDKLELLNKVGILLPHNGKYDEATKALVDANGNNMPGELLIRPLTEEELGIEGISTDGAAVRAIYNTQGVRTDKMQKGVNIIRLENGKTMKVRR